jgi:hypothetical protein
MPALAEPAAVVTSDVRPTLEQTPAPVRRSPWLISARFDLLFVANVFWPLFLLVGLIGSSVVSEALDFWMVYLLITPHRWVTLVLVFGDHDRYAERPRAFMGIAVAMTAVVATNAVAVPTLTLLLVMDYLWNALHFSAQHAGIARIYGRIAAPKDESGVRLEKYLLRAFCLYVIFRLGAPLMADDRSRWLGWLDAVVPVMTWTDLWVLAIPIYLLARDLARFTPGAAGRLAYLASVCVLYSTILLTTHFTSHREGANPIAAGLLIGVTVFHSTEYFAIVTWSVRKRYGKPGVGSGVMPKFAKRWVWFLVAFMGSLGLGAWMLHSHFVREWFLVNMLVSFLHYAYDGLIWKAKK